MPSVEAGAYIHEVTLVLAQWNGLGNGLSASQLKVELAGLINNQVSEFWNTATNGRLAFHVTATYGFISTTTPACDSGVGEAGDFWHEVANKVGFADGPGKHLVVWFPQVNCGGYSGLATVGSAGLDSGGWIWINGSKNWSLIAHELGHNFGLGNANGMFCSEGGIRVSDAIASQCIVRSYEDFTDIMGISHGQAGALNPRNLQNLGLLIEPDVIDVSETQQVKLNPLSAAPSTVPRVARVALNSDIYYVVVRARVGLDAWLNPELGEGDPGVAIYRAPSGWDNRASYLVDADPQTPDLTFASTKTILDQGQTMVLKGGAFSITAASVSSTGAVIAFQKDGEVPAEPPPTPTPIPTVTVTPTPTSPPPDGPAVILKKTSLQSGRLAKYGLVWTAPLHVSWTTVTLPLSQYVDSRPVLNTALQATTRLSLASNRAATDVVTVKANAANYTSTARDNLLGLLRTDDPQGSTVQYSGTWRKVVASGAHEGFVRRAWTRGSKVNVTTTGRSIAVVAAKGQNHAVVDIYVNGVRKAQVNTEASATSGGRVVWSANYSTAAVRTLTIIHRGSGAFDFDGVIELFSR